ncbi:MAG: sialate O-acetylesterase [Verrucomicrobiota bacterium]
MKRIILHLLLILCALFPAARCLQAASPAWTAANTGTAGPNSAFSLGYRFTVTNTIQVTHLGRVDYKGGGLAVPALARLYNWDTGAALASVTVPAGMSGRETNGVLAVHYAALTNAISLSPGVNYVVAVEVTGGDFGYGINATMADEVRWIEGLATPVGSPAMPTTANGTTFAITNSADATCYLGASFKFVASKAGVLTLTRPKTRQIVQRDGSNQASIRIQGTWSGTADRLEARAVMMPGATNNGVSTDWAVVVNAPTNGPFVGILPGVTAGGWYRVEIRAVYGGATTMVATGVDRIGVGDVFVTAGQSNAACFGSPTQRPSDDHVTACILASGAWQFAADPQPDNNPGGMGGGGSAWPILGSLLVQSNHVPVGFVGVAYGGSALSQWLPGTSFFQYLTNALRTFGTNGVRAVLWHQGETDSVNSTTAISYAQQISNVVASSRSAAGWSVPWGIAEVSFHPSAARSQEEPVAAGQRLFTYATTNCFRGARTDDLNLEGKLSDTVHFNTAGLTDHAQQWANVLCGVENLTPKNGNFEANTALTDGATQTGLRIIGWNRLNSAGTGMAVGGNGYFNPNNLTYPGSTDSINGGVLPNMNGRHVGTLAATLTNNAFLQTLKAHLQPSTIYTFTVALGVRSNATVFGGYHLDILANGAPLGTGVAGDLAALNALADGSATGAFTVVSCVYTSAVAVPTNQQLAIRITKPGGAGTYLDFDNVQVTSQFTSYQQWQMLHWVNLTDPASLPAADPDADGLPNLIEGQLAGMDPLVRNAMPLPVAKQVGGEDYLQMQLLKQPTGRAPGVVGLLMSYDLSGWFAPTNTPNRDVIVLDNPTEFTVQLRRSANPATFLRVWAQP